jgi:hypothetical protein
LIPYTNSVVGHIEESGMAMTRRAGLRTPVCCRLVMLHC